MSNSFIAKIKPFLLHEEMVVQDYALRLLEKSNQADETTLPIVLEQQRIEETLL
jgi:hypothetical protein